MVSLTELLVGSLTAQTVLLREQQATTAPRVASLREQRLGLLEQPGPLEPPRQERMALEPPPP